MFLSISAFSGLSAESLLIECEYFDTAAAAVVCQYMSGIHCLMENP